MSLMGFQLASCGYGTGLSFSQAHKEPTGSAQKLKPETALVLSMDFPFTAVDWVGGGQEEQSTSSRAITNSNPLLPPLPPGGPQ